jgi:DNA primase catalytic core
MDRTAEWQAEKQLVKDRNRMDEVARDFAGCEFERRGAGDLWACCPFHTEDTPSFHVLPARGMYKCFGCGESGDVFSFVQKIRGVGFKEALEALADRVGVTLGSLSPEDKRRQAELRDLKQVLVRAGEIFAEALTSPEGAAARDYLSGRGFDGEILKRFDVGLVPADFTRRLRQGGLAHAAVDRAGFTGQFGGRVSFGIRDSNGTLVGFGARTLEPDGKPKYVNTRETSAFNKRRLLYGLDKAVRAVSRSRRLIVMEGYTDVMMAHQRGLDESVATMGTSLTTDHIQALRGRASNLVFVFDGDEAGLRAADRAVEMTLQERIEVRVLCLPDGSDPGDWLRLNDGPAFEALLDEHGMSTVAYLCKRKVALVDRGQPGWREQVAADVLESCRSLIDPVRRETIVAEVSKACGVDRIILRNRVGAGPRAPRMRAHPPVATRKVNARVLSQFAILAGLSTREDAAGHLDELKSAGVLDHLGGLRLRELALSLGSLPVDPMDWLELVSREEPNLRTALERALLQGPDSVLPPYETALEHLRSLAQEAHARQERLDALTQPDIDRDEAALRAIDASLRARAAKKAALAAGSGPAGPGPAGSDSAAGPPHPNTDQPPSEAMNS